MSSQPWRTSVQNTGYAEGKVLPFDGHEKIRAEWLQTFKYEGYKQLMVYETGEFSAVCPYSGLPDIAKIIVTYVPDRLCIELKSLKYYFLSYRNVGIYQEPVTNRVFSDLYDLLKPQYLKIETIYNTRGGIDANCMIESGERYTPCS